MNQSVIRKIGVHRFPAFHIGSINTLKKCRLCGAPIHPATMMSKKGKLSSSNAMERGRTGDCSSVRNRLRQVACAAGHVLSMSRSSMVRRQPGSVRMLLVHITTKSRAEAYGLCCHLKPCWCPRALLCPCWSSTRPQQENWSHPSLATKGGALSSMGQRELAPMAWTLKSWPWWPGFGRSGWTITIGSPWLGRQQESWEECRWGSSIDGIAEATWTIPLNELIAMNICKQSCLCKMVYCMTHRSA